mgnify:FL=1
MRIDSFSYSEPYTLDGLLNNLSGDLSSGDVAMTFNEAKLTYAKDNWHISVLSRLDYLLEFNSDTAAIFHSIENDIALDVGRNYAIDLKAHHMISRGVQGGYKWHVDDERWLQADVTLLKSSKILSGELKGQWQETADGRQLTRLDLDYQYSKDLLFGEPVNHSDATGIAIDVAGAWQYSDQLSLDFKAQDLFSRIYCFSSHL